MLGQIYKAKTKGLRVKPTYDDIIDQTFKPVSVKYPDRRAEATFNSHLFGQIRDAIDETETADQMARIKDLGMRRASAQSGQSFHSAAASDPPQPPPSPIIADNNLERERYLQEQTTIAQDAVREATRQRELTTQQARAQLQYIADQDAVARQMNSQRLLELQDHHVAEIRQLQRHESNVSESIVLQERNAEIALRRQAQENQMQAVNLVRQLKYLQTREAEENQMQAMYLREQLQDEHRQLQDEYRQLQAIQMPLPLELRDEVSTELVAYNQALMGSSSSSSSASAAAAASSSSESVSTKAKTNTIKKTSLKASKSKMPQHTTKIEVGLSYDELEAKPRAYLLDQLDKRKVPLTISDRKSLSRDELAGLIVAADTDSTAALSMKLRKKLNKRTVDDQRKINAQNSMDV